MKKIFTLFFALFTMAFFANAQQQVTVILEAHNVWGDGSGYQLLLDADHTAYGTVIPTSGALTSDASTTVNYASTFEYTIPTNADGSASSTNVVVDGSVTITIPAGTYDFCVANPTPGDRIWIAAGDNGRKDDYVFDPAYVYHFTVAMNGQNDGVTIELTPATTDPLITVSPTTLDCGTANMPGYTTATATVNAYNLTTGITATTAAPFEVSADGTTYGTTATLAQTGGTLYVKYSPTVAGTDNGTITLTSNTTTATITLTGNAVDCSNITLPFAESFEGADCPATCWTIIYGDDNPSVNTMIHSTSAATDGSQSFRFSSYSSTTDYSQYLITPAMPAGNRMLMFDYAASNSSEETFQVGYSSTGTNPGDFTWSDTIRATNANGWQTYAEDVPANAVYVALKYFSDFKYYLYIDNFLVMEASEAIMANPSAMDFIGMMGTPTEAQTASFIGTSLTNNITITADAPFEVSVDNGATFAASASIPYSTTATVTNGDFQVRYNPTTAGNHTGIVVLTSGNSSDTISLTGNAVDCSAGIASLPYLYDFNTGLYPPLCWGYNDASNFMKGTIDEESGDYAIVIGDVDYLSSPEIHTTSPILFSIDYTTYGGSEASAPSIFRVGYSTTTDNYTDFTWMQPVSVMTDGFNEYTALLPAGTKYVAVEATEIGTYLMYGFFEYPNYLFFDNFSLEEINEPEIFAGATAIDFGTLSINTVATESITITSALLTSDITATTTDPFELSTDNNAFSATATIPATGGTLYVRYFPSAVGYHTGNVTLTSTGAASVQISLSGNAIDCSNAVSLPFVEDFQGELDECWFKVDADGDGHNWETRDVFTGHGGEGDLCISSSSYDGGALTPDNWLITPPINLSTNANLCFWINAQDASYAAEHYGVYISVTGTSISDFILLYEETMDADGGSRTQGAWKHKIVDLSEYTGEEVYIAFRHFNCNDMFWLNIDDIYVGEGFGINEVKENHISVYPNPANNYINVNATSNIENVEVYTISGQKVGNFTANSTTTTINTANLTSGLYLMKIHTENGVINQKFSVVR